MMGYSLRDGRSKNRRADEGRQCDATAHSYFQLRTGGTKLWNELNKETKLINNLASFKIKD